MSLQRLGTKNSSTTIGEVYGVVESIISKIVREFYRMVRVHLQQTLVQFPSATRFKVFAK